VKASQSPARLRREGLRAARQASLRYNACTDPGFVRRGKAPHFWYVDARGRRLTNAAHLARIRALVLPPAWTDVWISADPRGHLQATGRDARGRKQYRYHARWRAVRDQAKYEELAEFARCLPKLRRRIDKDLERPGIDRTRVLAAVVSLIEKTHARVGNERYAAENGSYGLTTLQDRHARPLGRKLELRFRAKAGKFARVSIDDARLSRIVRRCQDLPGQRLFQYLDASGRQHAVTSNDVNRYIREATGSNFTAKTFRTWAGTLCAALTFDDCEPCRSERAAKRTVTRVLEGVAEQLGNTPAVCRKSYVHPNLIAAVMHGTFPALMRQARRRRVAGVSREDALAIALFEALAHGAAGARDQAAAA
jgi:DNA topoisomerase I